MDRWDKLYSKVNRQKDAQAAADSVRVAAEEQEGPEEWCEVVTTRVMDALHQEVRARVAQLKEKTGAVVEVTFPAQAPNKQLAQTAPDMRFLKLTLGGNVVHAYSARKTGRLPTVHMVSAAEQLRPSADAAQKGSTLSAQRLVSEALYRVIRAPNGGYECVEPKTSGSAPLLLENVVYQLLDHLVRQWRRQAKR